jgi:hypothetical protein
LLDINLARMVMAFFVLFVSSTIREMTHAWTADGLGGLDALVMPRYRLLVPWLPVQ